MISGESLRIMRDALGLTQKEVSERTFLSIRTIKRIEKGDSLSPSLLHHLEMYYKFLFRTRE